MKNRGDILAVFLSLLIVLFPVALTDAWAASTGTIRNVQITGSDQIPSVTRVTDQRVVSAEVKIGDDATITPSQVLFNNLPFTSCVASTDGFSLCQYMDIFPQVIPAGQQGVSIKLKSDAGTVLATRSGSYMRDDSPPQVVLATFSATQLSGGDFTITVNVEDQAQSSVPGVCSGLESIRVYVDGILVDAVPVQENPCSFSGEIQRSAASLGSPGQKNICIGARDRFGLETLQANRKCSTITFDPIGLQIDGDSGVFFDGTQIRQFVRSNVANSNLKFTINVSDPDGNAVEASQVHGDFRGVGSTFNNRQANSCIPVGNAYSCSWTGVTTKLTADTNGVVIISAQDAAGNNAQASVTPFIIDDEAPQLSSLQTQNIGEDGSFFLGKDKNQLVAVISESGSGLVAEDIHASSPVFSGDATECFPNGCYWNFSLSGGSNGQKVKFTVTGKDLAGNTLTGNVDSQFTIDRTDPSFNGTIIILNQDNRNESFLREEDTISIIAFVDEEHSTMRAVANLSEATGTDSLEGTCQEDFDPFGEAPEGDAPEEDEEGSGLWTCMWTDVGPLIADNSARITLDFFDSAGNKDSVSKTLRISEKISSREQFWQSYKVVSQSPEKFSRELVGVAPMSMFMTMQLVPQPRHANEALVVKAFEPQGCFDKLGLIGAAETLSSSASDSKQQLVRFDMNPVSPLDEAGAPIGDLEIECSFSVITKLGNKLSSAETVAANFTVSFYDTPTGLLGENVVQQIEDIKDDVGGIEEVIAGLSKVVKLVEGICGLINVFSAIIASLSGMADALGCAGIISFGTAYSASTAMGKLSILGQGTTKHLWQKGLQWMCAVSSCTVFKQLDSTFGTHLDKYVGQNGWLRNPLGKKIGEATKDPACLKDPSQCETLAYTFKTTTQVEYRDTGIMQNQSVKMPLAKLELFSDKQIRASLPLSMLFGCVPGLVDYAIKLRENKCEKALCLRDQVAAGAPVEFCSKRYAYMNCKVVQGNWVALIPFQSLSDAVSNVIAPFAAFFNDPNWKAGGFLLAAAGSTTCNILCKAGCGQGCGGPCSTCSFLNMYTTVTQMYQTMKPLLTEEYWKGFVTPKGQACDRLFEEQETPATQGSGNATEAGV